MKILILRFSSIGDIVLTTPVVRCLKEQTGAELHFFTKKSYQGIVHTNPYIDKVFVFEKKIREKMPELRAEKYDVVIDLHNNLRSRMVCASLGVKNHAFDKLNLEKLLLVRFGWNVLPDVHIVHRYMKAVAPLGVTYDGMGLDFFIPENDKVTLTDWHPNLRSSEFLAFVIGATHATKRLPTHRIIAFCKKNAAKKIVLLGGPSEVEAGSDIEAATTNVLNLCGKLNLNQSADVVRQAERVISHDTGLMHIAAALKKNITSIWGSTVPAFGMYPFYPDDWAGESVQAEVKGLSCRPCSKIGYDACPKGHFRCMEDLLLP